MVDLVVRLEWRNSTDEPSLASVQECRWKAAVSVLGKVVEKDARVNQNFQKDRVRAGDMWENSRRVVLVSGRAAIEARAALPRH